jgi:DegV family protein with EDD domain
MVAAISVVTDSSCDLSPEVVREYEIEVVPLTVQFGTDVYRDGELTADEFWAKAHGPHQPTTSQPSVGTFERVFARLVDRGSPVVCTTVTSKHSGTFNAARLAAERFGDVVRVFDSHSMSLGLGAQALAAAQAARAGKSMQEVISLLEGLRERAEIFVVLDTLENLRRGGRADTFIAIAERMTRALNIKVYTNMVDGQLRLMGAARSLKGAIRRVLEQVEQCCPLEQLAVVHTRNRELAEDTAARLAELTGMARTRIGIEETRGVLAVHAGPGVVAVFAVPEASGAS